jgi:putative addiction module component (TIGR02574 family)
MAKAAGYSAIGALAAPMPLGQLITMGDPAFDYRRLPVPERLKLMDDIWDSIAQDATAQTLPVSDADKALLDQRLAELEQNPDAGADWPDVRARILSRFKK